MAKPTIPEISNLVAMLVAQGVSIALAVKQAEALNAQPAITPDDEAKLDVALDAALDNSEVVNARAAVKLALANAAAGE